MRVKTISSATATSPITKWNKDGIGDRHTDCNAVYTSALIVNSNSSSSVVTKAVSGSTGVDPFHWYPGASQQIQPIITTADIETITNGRVTIHLSSRGVKPAATAITRLVSPADQSSISVTAQLTDCHVSIFWQIHATKVEIYSCEESDRNFQ